MAKGAAICFVWALCEGVPSLPASTDSSIGIPVALRQTAACMLDVLGTMPRVSDQELIVTTRSEVFQGNDWLHLNLVYTYSEWTGERHTILFEGTKSREGNHDVYGFSTVLPGLHTPGTKWKLDDWGTGTMAKEWKLRCNANISVQIA
jgi:hypothetical protein